MYLEDIIDAINSIEEYTRGLTFDAFVEDRRTVDAVIRNFEIIGEATITLLDLKTADEVISEFREKLFLSQQELNKYVSNRKDRKMLVLVLKDLRKYARPFRIARPVTMAGMYMTDEILRSMMEDVQH